MEHAVLKTIVAFLNSKGGILLIGVADDGKIIGIAEDEFKTNDKFLLHFTHLFTKKIGKEFGENISYDLYPIDNKIILKIDCTPSSTPVFLKEKGKEEFYIRTGPSSIPLSLSQFNEYVQKHFNK